MQMPLHFVSKIINFRFPTVTETFGIDRQFMWGPGLMISPVLEEVSTMTPFSHIALYFFDSRVQLLSLLFSHKLSGTTSTL